MTFSALDSELTGPLFATAEMRAVFSDRARIAAMLKVEAALARALAESGLAPEQLAGAIENIAAGDLDLRTIGEETAIAGVPTIPFIKVVESCLPPDLIADFHRGATTQDIVDTGLALQLRDAFGVLLPDLDRTLVGLSKLALSHRRTPMAGRTYGQHAAPLTFGYKAAVWCLGLAEVVDRLTALRARILVATLGGPVGTLSILGKAGPAVEAAFARHLGLRPSPIPFHVIRLGMAETGSWLAMLVGVLAKIATDVAHLASTEVGEVAEPYVAGRGGSTAMPHKRNPVAATVILAAHGAAAGHLATLVGSMAAAHERPAGAWHAEWHALPQLFGLASGALREAAHLSEGLVVFPERMQRNLELTGGLIFAEAARDRLSRTMGREKAHRAVARAADQVRHGAASLADALADDPSIPQSTRAGLGEAFGLAPSIEAAALWTDRALARIEDIRTRVLSGYEEPYAKDQD